MNKITKVKNFIIYAFLVSFLYVSDALAQPSDPNANNSTNTATSNSVTDLKSFFGRITDILKESVVGLLVTLAMVYFIWGVVQYVIYPEDEGKKEKGKQHIIWGLIGLTVIFAVRGLIGVLASSFDLDVFD